MILSRLYALILLTTSLSVAADNVLITEIVADQLQAPSGIAFLPDGRALVSERRGARISLLDLTSGEITPLSGLPALFNQGGGGVLDVVLHPDYQGNGWIYYSYTVQRDVGKTAVAARARLRETELVDQQILFTALPFDDDNSHFGGRLVLHDGYMYLTIGDRHLRQRSQDVTSHIGTVIRLHDDGRVPADNPFVGQPGALPEIWTYGHRNPQGLVLHPDDGSLWLHEHGPQGGDEINLILPGRNYGWPVITYGEEYGGGPVGDGITRKEGMEQPLYYYVPSIAPSGMTFYTGSAFPDWKGNLLLGALGLRHLNMLQLDGHKVVSEQRLLEDKNWRIRVVVQGPDDLLYIGVDDGMIIRLKPPARQ